MALTREEVQLADALLGRVAKLAAAASDKGVRLMIDAEHTYFQPVGSGKFMWGALTRWLGSMVFVLLRHMSWTSTPQSNRSLLCCRMPPHTTTMPCVCPPAPVSRPLSQAIDHTTQVLSLKYNRSAPVIFNTYQVGVKARHTQHTTSCCCCSYRSNCSLLPLSIHSLTFTPFAPVILTPTRPTSRTATHACWRTWRGHGGRATCLRQSWCVGRAGFDSVLDAFWTGLGRGCMRLDCFCHSL